MIENTFQNLRLRSGDQVLMAIPVMAGYDTVETIQGLQVMIAALDGVSLHIVLSNYVQVPTVLAVMGMVKRGRK